MANSEHVLERSVLIRAARDTVFRYFTDSRRFADWWGPGSSIEGRVGGEVRIVYPGGTAASGQVLELVKNERVVFSYGYDAPGAPLPPGGSRVVVTLEDRAEGTLLHLKHELPDAATREAHLSGWGYQLALFANVAAKEQHSAVATLVDRYLAIWSEADAGARARTVAAVLSEDVGFRDSFGCARGREELLAHIAAAQTHMPGLQMRREGEARQCQGMALVDWSAVAADGSPRGRGTNVFQLAPDGRITDIVGFWG
jgi:uncharacterized protein YndB with AHSA1/START domain